MILQEQGITTLVLSKSDADAKKAPLLKYRYMLLNLPSSTPQLRVNWIHQGSLNLLAHLFNKQ
jgi:hypothetical protein